MDVLVNGFGLGLTTGAACLAHCFPLLIAYLLTRRDGNTGSAVRETGLFLLGRFLAYLGVAAVVSLAGSAMGSELTGKLLPPAYIFVAIALLLTLQRHAHTACRGFAPRWRSGLTLGLLTGITICPPFLGAIAFALGFSNPVKTMLYFCAFYLGTTAYFIPLPIVGALYRIKWFPQLMRALTIGIALFFLFTGVKGLGAPRYYRYTIPEEILRSQLPGTSTVIRNNYPYPVYHLIASSGTVLGYSFVTDEVVPGVNGFAGPVPALVTLTPDATIAGVVLLPNRETPAYAEPLRAAAWLEQFIGRSAYADLLPGRDIEGITGATLSTGAACRGIQRSCRHVANQLLHVPPPGQPRSGFIFRKTAIIVFIYLLIVIGLWLHGSPRQRLVLLGVSAVVLGWWLKAFLSFQHIVTLSAGNLEYSWASVPFLLIVFAVATALITGRVYCGWVCPFGAVQELLGTLIPRRKKKKLPAGRPGPARYLKFIVLVTVIALITTGRGTGALRVEPFTALFAGGATLLGLSFVIFILLISLIIPRYFCRYLCPLGAVLALFSRLAVWRWRLPDHPGGNGQCERCGQSCPTGALYIGADGNVERDPIECIECRNCHQVCPRRCRVPEAS